MLHGIAAKMCPIGRCTKINTGLSPSASLLYHTGAFLSTAFRGLFPYASPGKRRSFMIHGSTILARGKHGRLYGGCPPRSLYHTHKLKSMGENVLAQSWHKCNSPRSISERGLKFYSSPFKLSSMYVSIISRTPCD